MSSWNSKEKTQLFCQKTRNYEEDKAHCLTFSKSIHEATFCHNSYSKTNQVQNISNNQQENGLYGMYIRVKSLHKYVCACNFAQHPSRHSPNFHPSTMIICVKELAVLAGPSFPYLHI